MPLNQRLNGRQSPVGRILQLLSPQLGLYIGESRCLLGVGRSEARKCIEPTCTMKERPEILMVLEILYGQRRKIGRRRHRRFEKTGMKTRDILAPRETRNVDRKVSPMRTLCQLLAIGQVRASLRKRDMAATTTGLVPSEAIERAVAAVAFAAELEEMGLDGDPKDRVDLFGCVRDLIQGDNPIALAEIFDNGRQGAVMGIMKSGVRADGNRVESLATFHANDSLECSIDDDAESRKVVARVAHDSVFARGDVVQRNVNFARRKGQGRLR